MQGLPPHLAEDSEHRGKKTTRVKLIGINVCREGLHDSCILLRDVSELSTTADINGLYKPAENTWMWSRSFERPFLFLSSKVVCDFDPLRVFNSFEKRSGDLRGAVQPCYQSVSQHSCDRICGCGPLSSCTREYGVHSLRL